MRKAVNTVHMVLQRMMRVIAPCALVVGGVAASPDPGISLQPLATIGLLVQSDFVSSDGGLVHVEAATFPRDRVTLRVVDYPNGGPRGETVLLSLQLGGIAAINGGYFTEDYRPDGLLEVDGVVRQPARGGLSGVVGSSSDDAPVVALAEGIDTAKLRDALQTGPFLVDPGGAHGIRRDDGKRARRSLVILTKDRIAVAVTSRCGLYDLATALVRSPWFFGVDDVERALNLDGGPSSGFAVRLSSGGLESVPESTRLRTVLRIVARLPSPAPSPAMTP